MTELTGNPVAVVTGAPSDLRTALVREILQKGGAVFSREMMARNEAEVREAINECLHQFGRIDLLINCPAVSEPVSFLEMRPELWERNTTDYLRTVFLWTREICRWFKSQGRRGKVLNVSCMRPELMDRNFAAFITAQAGITALTKTLAREFAPLGIEVKLIEPGNRKLYYEDIDRV